MIGKAPGLPDPLFRQRANPLPRNETGYTFMRHTNQETGNCKFTRLSICLTPYKRSIKLRRLEADVLKLMGAPAIGPI